MILSKLIKNQRIQKSINRLLIIVFVGVNAIGLVAMAQKSAGIGRMEITKHIDDKYETQSVNLIFCTWGNPYDPWQSVPMKFYQKENVFEQEIQNLCELGDSLYLDEAVNLLVIRKADLENKGCAKKLREEGFDFEIQSVPGWIEKLNEKQLAFHNRDVLVLYRKRN